jgi:hypothetical protein
MRDDLGIGLRAELGALPLQLGAQLAEILDDAVVHDGQPIGGVGMGVTFGRLAVRRPAGVADADGAVERLAREPRFESAQLALGAPTGELPAFQRGHACGVVAAVLQPLERLDQRARNRFTSENAHNAAHASGPLRFRCSNDTPATLYRR